MSIKRRNRIEESDDYLALGIGAAAGVLAAFSGAEPTGSTAIDAVLLVAFTTFVTWACASAPWWALLGGAGIVTVASIGGPLWVTILGLAAVGVAAWISAERLSQPPIRAAIGAATVNVALRIEWDPFFAASALLAGVVTVGLATIGVMRRRKYIRKRVRWGVIGLAAFAIVAAGLFAVAGLGARTEARDGYIGMLDGLEFIQNGEIDDAAITLREAAADLDSSSDSIGGLLSQPARLVPGLAQNRNASAELLEQAAAAAESAADALDVVDLDQLTVSGGSINVLAFEALEAPLADLDTTINDLNDALLDAESPWLVPPLATRLDDAIDRADKAAHQATATAAAARIGPELLGADGPRRYFVAFVNAAEARGMSGLMGNWSEITIDDGSFSVSANGRTARLQDEVLNDLELDAPQEYIDRYAYAGASIEGGGVSVKYWSNVTTTPHMPSVGNAMRQMYEAVSGTQVDGVFVIDAVGLAALLEITGPVEVDIETETDDGEIEVVTRRIDSGNAAEFLSRGQYEFAENEREDLLAAITDETVENVLTETLPAPQRMAPILAPAVLHGHISGWAADPDEQELFELVGMDASMPVITTAGMDAIAVSNNNAGGNKIDSFLERTITYRPVANERTGDTTATLQVEFTNTAPSSGYADYVIGNLVDAPQGTNRMIVDVYTRLNVDEVQVDDEVIEASRLPELGYWVTSVTIDVGPGDTAVLELDLSGNLSPAGYQLAYRPQPLPNPDVLDVVAVTSGGDTVFEYEGEIERRTVFNANGISAWR